VPTRHTTCQPTQPLDWVCWSLLQLPPPCTAQASDRSVTELNPCTIHMQPTKRVH